MLFRAAEVRVTLRSTNSAKSGERERTQNRSLTLATAALALAVSTFTASAADIAAPVYKAPVIPAFSWAGFYLGGSVGGGLMNSDFFDGDEELAYGFMQASKGGAIAGVTVGYNWQFGPAVVGLEGDFNWTGLKASFYNNDWDSQFTTKWNWLSTIRGRAGIAVDRALFYVTGGAAFVDAEYLAYYPSAGCGGSNCADLSKTQVGFAVGAGLEYAFAPNWSAKLEYLYVGLPAKEVIDSNTLDPDDQYSFKSNAHFLRIGVNYKFGGFGAYASAAPGSSAWAADLPVYKARVAPAFSWAGFYLGGSVGGGLMNSDFFDGDEELSYGFMQASKGGAIAGVTAGYNWQFGPAVVGLEGDFSWTSLKASFTNNQEPSEFTAKWNWLSTVRVRAGLAVDRSLLYVTGGAAFVDAEYLTYDPSSGCGGDNCASLSKTQVGFVAGAGFEHAFAPNWSAKLEYLYVGLPTKDVIDSYSLSPNDQYSFKSSAHFLRLGLNYKFDGFGNGAYASASPGSSAWASAAPVYNWAGFYLGGTVGGGLLNSDLFDAYENLSYGFMQASKGGAIAGVTAGYNWQFGSAVVGLEGDFSWTSLKASLYNNNWDSQFTTKWNWVSTVRARAGLAVDRALLYVTGGAAFVDAKYLAYYPSSGCGNDHCAEMSKTQVGFAAGAGAEYAFAPNWSAKIEYLYVGLPTKEVFDSYDPTDPYDQYSFKSDAHFVRVGVNYRFDGTGR